MAIVFYISGHGFGHASRQVEIINAVGAQSTEPVIVRSAVTADLLERTIRVPFVHEPGACDTGIVQRSSLAHDDVATVDAALAFDVAYDSVLRDETRRLAGRDVRLIVGDIPPLAFDVAEALGVTSVAIANFTWDWIYETHPGFLPRGRGALDRIRAAYRKASLALALPYPCGFEVFSRVEQLPLVARHASRTRSDTRRHFGLPAERPVALLSFGGYGLPDLSLDRLDCREAWTIVTTDRVSASDAARSPHVHVVAEHALRDSGFRYEDLVAAVDVVITKPGYGIVAECASTGTAMLYTSRGTFREYEVLVGALSELVRSRFISQEDLFAGRWLEALTTVLDAPTPPVQLSTDGADVAAARLVELL